MPTWPSDTPDWLKALWDKLDEDGTHLMTMASELPDLLALKGRFKLLEEMEADIDAVAAEETRRLRLVAGAGGSDA